jgi:chromosome segregation ATPase
LLQAQRCQALEDQLAKLRPVEAGLDSKLGEMLQAKLLEVERLTSQLAELRKSNEEWRTQARNHRRELDVAVPKLEQATAQLSELRARDESNQKRIAELERTVTEQRRELELAERRAQHMRQHITAR